MPETVYVQRVTETPDAAGGRTQVIATIATTKGRIVSANAGLAEQAGRLDEQASYTVTIPADANVQVGDFLQINGAQYTVIGKQVFSRRTAMRVNCTKD